MKEQVISILKEGISDIEKVKRQYPAMRTQDVLDALRRLEDRINELTIPAVSQRSELLAFAREMQNIGLNPMDDIEKVVDIYLKANCG